MDRYRITPLVFALLASKVVAQQYGGYSGRAQISFPQPGRLSSALTGGGGFQSSDGNSGSLGSGLISGNYQLGRGGYGSSGSTGSLSGGSFGQGGYGGGQFGGNLGTSSGGYEGSSSLGGGRISGNIGGTPGGYGGSIGIGGSQGGYGR